MHGLLKLVFAAQASIHAVEVHGKTMDSRPPQGALSCFAIHLERGNDELLHLGLSKRHSY
jgi:hypothetical protein